MNKETFMVFADSISYLNKKSPTYSSKIRCEYFKITAEHKKNFKSEFAYHSILLTPLASKKPMISANHYGELEHILDRYNCIPYEDINILRLSADLNNHHCCIKV